MNVTSSFEPNTLHCKPKSVGGIDPRSTFFFLSCHLFRLEKKKKKKEKQFCQPSLRLAILELHGGVVTVHALYIITFGRQNQPDAKIGSSPLNGNNHPNYSWRFMTLRLIFHKDLSQMKWRTLSSGDYIVHVLQIQTSEER